MSNLVPPTDAPKTLDDVPKLNEILQVEPKSNVEDDPVVALDKGVFFNELLKQGLTLSNEDNDADGIELVAKSGLQTGTYQGTQMALTEMYSLLEEAYDRPSGGLALDLTDTS